MPQRGLEEDAGADWHEVLAGNRGRDFAQQGQQVTTFCCHLHVTPPLFILLLLSFSLPVSAHPVPDDGLRLGLTPSCVGIIDGYPNPKYCFVVGVPTTIMPISTRVIIIWVDLRFPGPIINSDFGIGV